MHCRRCQGLMQEAQFFDFQRTEGFMWMRGWRCRDCGHAIDPLREANRRLRTSNRLARPLSRKPTEAQSPEAERERKESTWPALACGSIND
jgi:hypothetical protein